MAASASASAGLHSGVLGAQGTSAQGRKYCATSRQSRSSTCWFSELRGSKVKAPQQSSETLRRASESNLRIICASLSSSSPEPCSADSSSRRAVLRNLAVLSLLPAFPTEASALTRELPPDGYRIFKDNFDGYYFFVPDTWIQVTGAGADCFFRDGLTLDENVSVNVSSPSSSRYKAINDLGDASEAAEFLLRKYLTEFMSTRIGVERSPQLISSQPRTTPDGQTFYDIQVNVKSYANSNQLAILPEERVRRLEWERRYLSVVGVENGRLYELRLQVPESLAEREKGKFDVILNSFRLRSVAEGP